MMKWKWLNFGLWLVLFLVSCQSQDKLRVATTENIPNNNLTAPQKTNTPNPDPTSSPSLSPTDTPRIVGDFSVAPFIVKTLPAETPAPTTVAIPGGGGDPLAALSIEALAARPYGQDGGTLTFESTLENTGGFSRYLISYPSDGLKIYGFINIPDGIGPFPVVIFLHGYVNAVQYETLDYSVRYTDDLARRGFIVIHPNLRGYPPSDNGPDLFDTGKAVDVLNLVALIQRDAGKTDLLTQANPNKIALWGHSTGGGIAIRVATIDMPSATGPGPAVKAVILYAPMSGDEAKNAYHNYYVFTQPRFEYEASLPPDMLLPISPATYYARIEVPVQIHHGAADKLIPIEWSRETCKAMQAAGVTVECYEYRTQTHNFCCDSYQWMLDRLVSFLFVYMP